jgi:phosphoribosylaminoimidazole (AIR) synthetase
MYHQLPEIVLTMGVAHLLRIDLASSRAIKRMVDEAMNTACGRALAKGAIPISAVDDLTIHAVGPWIDIFAQHLSGAALRKGISIVGGEMAQMRDSYSKGYAGVVISVVSLKHKTAEPKLSSIQDVSP